MNKSKTIHLFIVLIVALAGCAKDGATGPTGPQGTAGTNGTNGNANVTAQTFSVTSWSSDSYDWYTQFTVPALTSAAQSSGAVEVFFSSDNGTDWVALPWTVVSSTNYYMYFITATNLVEIDWKYNGVGIGSNPNTFFSATSSFKVVVIPPVQRASHPKVNWKNYEEIKTVFNLND